ncbi:hypothetical protein [Pleomorphomonas sp. NRK KF1]|uniref:hypothetical protein n=1 Tax=Pleomorphomonas sp. NRK KF1 TaxID=2943000 RepID=UPI00204380D7|nr:hypothetical protein [Pleomorphomonas sp. NRK KF1]MCM5552381.1 hypothetical protein [Pleomorphomonas sp. NRK KF1]
MRQNETYLVSAFVLDAILLKNMNASDVSASCGFESVTTFERIMSSEQRLPLDRVDRLAESLQCERKRLWALALTDWFGEELASSLADAFQSPELSRANDSGWITCGKSIQLARHP